MASRLQDVILRGTRAAQPAIADVAPGTLYYVTDEFLTERAADNLSAWQSFSDSIGVGITQLTGDVTAGPGSGSVVATIPNDTVTFAKQQNIASGRVLGRGTAASGDIEELTPTSGIETTTVPGIRQTTAALTRILEITIDGGGVAITTGVKGYKSFPVAGLITRARLLADQVGSIVVDIWKDTFANAPPTIADTITAFAKPTLAAAQKSENTTLVGWTTAVAAGDVFGFNVDSATTVTRVTLELTILITG